MKPLENLLNPEDPLPEGERPGMFGTMVKAQEQWMKVRPGQVLYLRKKGMLRAALADAASRTSDRMVALIESGAHPWTAIEEANREHLWLPDEEEEPVLEPWQAPYGQPEARKASNGATAADEESGVAFCDGRYVPVAEARISVLDWGFARSDTTYDVVHVWKGRFFRLEDHLDRFERSCRLMRLDPGLDRDGVRGVLMECVRRSGLRDAYVKLACTRGQPAPGSRDPRTCRNTFFAFAVPFIWIFPPERQEQGIHLILSTIPRIPPASVDPTAKNFHWGDLNRGLYEARERGGDTVVLSDLDGNVSEGPGFNVFRVAGGRVTTPAGTVLEGITRLTVQELCDELRVGFEYGTVSAESLREADEAFLSSTAGGVIPVTRIDDRILSNDAPGSITTRIRDLYWRKHDEGWHGTPVDY